MIRKLDMKRRGVVVILACVTMAVILSVLALSLDGGALMAERRRAQAVADAAAMAGACDIYDNYWTNMGDDVGGTAKASALATAKANGYANDGTLTTVTVNIPPASGHYKGVRGYVEVIAEYHYGRSFSTIFSSEPVTVKARAVAIGSPVAADVGILVLDPKSKSTFNAQGGGVSTVKGTPIVVNSNHPEAAIAGGGGTVQADKFVITGGYNTTGGGSFIGPIYTGRPGIPDPLADITPPDPSEMTVQANRKIQHTSGNVYLKPGVFKGGINVSGTANLYLEPGIYYMDNGGFNFSGQGSLKGEGVMIYTNPGNGNSDTVSVTGQGSMILSGPKTGKYKGITFWQRRDSTVTGTVSGTGGETSITGTFYFAGALLNVSGNGGVANLGSQYISWQLNLGGNGGINIDWGPDKVAPRRSIFLVE
jgi:Flp pilus assembly protein TadG